MKKKSNSQPVVHGMRVKKEHGQNFLRDDRVLHEISQSVKLNNANILEIGCGDGALTKTILDHPVNKMLVYEIDPEWAEFVKNSLIDDRLVILQENFLDADLSLKLQDNKWTITANLPYHVTFPILRKFITVIDSLEEGVIMVQEEVAQRLVAIYGRAYGYVSIYFQCFFDWKLLSKVGPASFFPSPKVNSRLLYFIPKKKKFEIINEEAFWKFIKAAFSQPRRMLRNCLASFHYDVSNIEPELLALRAQQIESAKLLEIWVKINLTNQL